MGLTDRSRAAAIDGSEAVALSAADTEELLALYAASYPGNWFVPRMLETGFYFGIRRGRALVSVAGVHVFSPQYKVAALGNITTRPDARGQDPQAVIPRWYSRQLGCRPWMRQRLRQPSAFEVWPPQRREL
jgi:hypothetical protein